MLASAVLVLSGCAVKGTPTWPGARLNEILLTAADFPPGVQFDRIKEQPGQAGGPTGRQSAAAPVRVGSPAESTTAS